MEKRIKKQYGRWREKGKSSKFKIRAEAARRGTNLVSLGFLSVGTSHFDVY